MEGIFWLIVIFLVVLSAILALATLAGIIGGFLLFRSRGHQNRRSQARIGIALLVVGALPFACVCANAVSGLANVVPRLSYLPRAVDPSTPEIQAMFASRLEAGAEQKCFTPIEPTARVQLEHTYNDDATYDIMLHVYGSSSRTIAFEDLHGSFRWLGEQETFTGPNQFPSSSGYSYEQITVTFDTVYISGAPLNTLFITYLGEDPRLAHRLDLTCEDIRPVLTDWGALPQE